LKSDQGRDFLDDRIFSLGIPVLPNSPNRTEQNRKSRKIRLFKGYPSEMNDGCIFSQFQKPPILGSDQDSDGVCLTDLFEEYLINPDWAFREVDFSDGRIVRM
jgi:hypothetical protein